jgi:protoporphyrinogen oxidase
LVLKARKVKHWEPLEGLTAEEWLISLCGRKVYEVVWEPLLRGKFGPYAKEISAVWFWNKLKLRGGSRGKKGAEQLAYFQGGFAHLAELMAAGIVKAGGSIHVSTPVESLIVENGKAVGVKAGGKEYLTDAVLATPALPIIAKMVAPYTTPQYVKSLEKIEYLANICLVLELDRSLSKIYWLNVNDVNFPFVGIIEHTNFEPPESYSGRHIVYLSKYLPADHEMYHMTPEQVLEISIPHIQRMFPEFRREWIQDFHLWKARYSQPIVVKHYSKLIPDYKTPIPGLFISSMAQVYPEDRGTNYAIRDGRKVGKIVADDLKASSPKGATNGIASPSGNSRHPAGK